MAVLRYAAEHGVGDRVTEDAAAELPQADVVALALHPQGIVDFLARYRDAFSSKRWKKRWSWRTIRNMAVWLGTGSAMPTSVSPWAMKCWS